MSDVQTVGARVLYPGGGAAPLHDQVLHIADGRIERIAPASGLHFEAGTQVFDAVAPGFVDLQINGGGGVLFNDAPTPESIARIAQAARAGGTTHILPTFITAPGTAYREALRAVSTALESGVPGVLGAHLEGPFLSPRRPGIHPAGAIRPLTEADCDVLCAFPHALLLTLAPECQDHRLIARLVQAGIRVFAGHTEASAEDILAASEIGLVGVTHLWNAMLPPLGRAPGTVGAALGHSGGLMAGIIADGIHVDRLNLATSARAMAGRLFLVTDAMPTLNSPETRFEIGGISIHFDGARLVSPDGTLAGAHLSMDQAVRTMVRLASVAPETALDMASGIPAAALGLEGRLGRIAEGRMADLTFLDADLTARGTMIGGRWH